MTLVEGIIIAALGLTAYKKLPPEIKTKLENWVKTHHFEYGIGTVAGGAIAKSPTAVGAGLTMIADDWKDKDVAIQNIENKIDSAVIKIRSILQNINNKQNSTF